MHEDGAAGGTHRGGHPLAGGAGVGAVPPFSPHDGRLLYASLLLMARHAMSPTLRTVSRQRLRFNARRSILPSAPVLSPTWASPSSGR